MAVEFAERTGLPYIESSMHVAAYLGVSPSLIRQIMHKPSYHYREFTLKKTDGGERKISTPKTYLKVVQWWILDNILARQPLGECVHGFRSGRSYVTNAQTHEKSRHILNVDIKSFFDSIKISQVSNVFASLGYSESGSLALTALTTIDGIAPTGAPTSPMIANLIFRDADVSLVAFAQANGLIYTRYADDLTFSAQHRIAEEIVDQIAEIVDAAGFRLNTKKTKFMGPGDRKDVTGVVVNSRLNAPREWRNWARGYLHRIRLNPTENAGEVRRVRGIYGTLRQFDPEHATSLTRIALQTLNVLKQAR
ncbi:reverse transcriptase domain-containing protein [Brucella intermedia]|uniref:reverse transcriptase domain-containing protein n=1 Tax=Brucella intermedia TaxID=94625 RepID=UPI00178C55F1|nr:reverse transcriptase domain-containing protein [Brucella intermedia]